MIKPPGKPGIKTHLLFEQNNQKGHLCLVSFWSNRWGSPGKWFGKPVFHQWSPSISCQTKIQKGHLRSEDVWEEPQAACTRRSRYRNSSRFSGHSSRTCTASARASRKESKGVNLSRKPPKTLGKWIWLLNRTMVEKSGKGMNPRTKETKDGLIAECSGGL